MVQNAEETYPVTDPTTRGREMTTSGSAGSAGCAAAGAAGAVGLLTIAGSSSDDQDVRREGVTGHRGGRETARPRSTEVEWPLDSLKVYTRLLRTDKEEVEVDVPAGAVIVVALLTLKPSTERTIAATPSPATPS